MSTVGVALRILLDAAEITERTQALLPVGSREANGRRLEDTTMQLQQAGAEFGFIFGISLACCAAISNNVGLQLQKLAHTRLKKQQLEQGNEAMASYLKSKMWFTGMILVITASVFDVLALGYAPLSVIAPLGSMTMALNIITVPLFQKEMPTWRDILGIGITVGGTILCVMFSSHTEEAYDLDGLFALYRREEFWIYAGIVVALIFGTWYFSRWASRYSRRVAGGTDSPEYKNKMLWKHRLGYGAMAGVMGAQSVVFAKTTSASFIITFGGTGLMFKYYQTYLIMIAVGVTVFFQVRWLNSGLKKFSAMVVVPIFQTFWIITSVIGGLVVYDEFRSCPNNVAAPGCMTDMDKFLFVAGACITIIGVYVLSSGKTERNVMEKEIEKEAERIRRSRIESVTTIQGGESNKPESLVIPRRRKKLTLMEEAEQKNMETLSVPEGSYQNYQWDSTQGKGLDPKRSRSMGAKPSEMPPEPPPTSGNYVDASAQKDWEQSFWRWSDFLDGITIGGTAMGRLTYGHTFQHYDDNFNFMGHPGAPGTVAHMPRENERTGLLNRRSSAPSNVIERQIREGAEADSVMIEEERRAHQDQRYYTPPNPDNVSPQTGPSSPSPERRQPPRSKSTPPGPV